jgi:hypothetical protein
MTEPKKETPQEQSAKEDAIKQAKADTASPDQKHQAYLNRLETLHNEP